MSLSPNLNRSRRLTRPTHLLRAAAIAAALWAGGHARPASAAVEPGAKALLADDVAGKLKLTDAQRRQIQAITQKTSKKFQDARAEGKPNPELNRIRQGGQDEAVALLTPDQKLVWEKIVAGEPVGGADKNHVATDDDEKAPEDAAARSLIIPTIDQMRHPPSPTAYGPTSSILQTTPHPAMGDAYVVVTDYTDATALAALDRLAAFHKGTVLKVPSLAALYQSPEAFNSLQASLRKLKPKFVAIAPKPESYRENTHLAMLRVLASLDSDPQLDAFPGYLVAEDGAHLAALVDRTLAFKPMSGAGVNPVSLGTIEDDGVTRYRAYQKAKVLQKKFADEGKPTPAVLVVTNPSLTKRSDFPKLAASDDNVVMQPKGDRKTTYGQLSDEALQAITGKNVLFMFGHGVPDRLCGTKVSAWEKVDFSNRIVFCGSCMSASPAHADRVNLDRQADVKRFGTQAMDNGAVMVLGHMGLCGGFPEVYPVAEAVFDGVPAGEAYQRVINAMIGRKPFPPYYTSPPPEKAESRDPQNNLLLILWGDPALTPIKK